MKALIVVDMQKDFIDGALGTPEAVAIVPAVAAKIEKARQEGALVIFTRDTHGEDYMETQEGRNLPVSHCIKGTPGWEISDALTVGVPLFNRSTRQVTLTDAGRALQISAKELISRWEKMIPEVRNLVPEAIRAASLTIGVDVRALEAPDRRLRVAELLYGLRQKHPGLRILMRNCEYQALISGVEEGVLDCALILDREMEARSGLQSEIFGHEEMVLAFRSDNPHGEGDYAGVIMNRGLILVDKEPQGLYHIIRILSDLGLEPQIRFCENLQDMTMTVETGESAMILPESVAARLNNPRLQTLHLPSGYAKLKMTLIWSETASNPMLRELRAGLREVLFPPVSD